MDGFNWMILVGKCFVYTVTNLHAVFRLSFRDIKQLSLLQRSVVESLFESLSFLIRVIISLRLITFLCHG